MLLSINNIGLLSKAKIEISGLTVLAGVNGTGKSTISKCLYVILNGYCFEQLQFNKAIRSAINSALITSCQLDIEKSVLGSVVKLQGIADQIFESDRTRKTIKLLLDEIPKDLGIQVTEQLVDTIIEALNFSKARYFKARASMLYTGEFQNQANENGTLAKIEIQTNQGTNSVELSADRLVKVNSEFTLYRNSFYLDDPNIIDFLSLNRPTLAPYHRQHLFDILKSADDTASLVEKTQSIDKYDRLLQILAPACSGSLVNLNGKHAPELKLKNNKKPINLFNLSTGIKSFLLIKTLILKGLLTNGSTLILDEPEVHLHPDWQILLAELLIALQQEFGIKILLTSHSPYFINAIQVFSRKYKTEKNCKFYHLKKHKEGIDIADVTNNVNVVFSEMASAFRNLKRMEYEQSE